MKSLLLSLVGILIFVSTNAQERSNKIPVRDSVLKVSLFSDTNKSIGYFGQKILIKTKGIDDSVKRNEHIILFINDIPVNSCEAKPSVKNRQNLIFDLGDTSVIHEIWKLHYVPNKNERSFKISAGIKGGEALPAKNNNFTIIFYFKNWLYGAYASIALLLISFILLGLESDLIKDPTDSKKSPYSLSRFQLALWTFIIASSFIYIWIIKNDYNSLNDTALILLGISAVTAISGSIIMNNQKNQDLTNTLQTKSSEGFFLDILSDENGVSVHRFQNLLFNIILGFIFLNHVYENLSMPSFDGTILTLMGISAGTYAALKTTENRALTNTGTNTNLNSNQTNAVPAVAPK